MLFAFETLAKEFVNSLLTGLDVVNLMTFVSKLYFIIFMCLFCKQPTKQKISDPDELADYKLRKRKVHNSKWYLLFIK